MKKHTTLSRMGRLSTFIRDFDPGLLGTAPRNPVEFMLSALRNCDALIVLCSLEKPP